YHAIREAAIANKAKAAAAVVIDVRTGEILALANWPSSNPNDRNELDVALLRNRAALDTFEPGSTIKPFTVAAAIDSGRFGPGTTIDTSPGHMKIGGWRIGDHGKDFGRLDLTGIIAKSSNVGTAKLALAMTPERMGATGLARQPAGCDPIVPGGRSSRQPCPTGTACRCRCCNSPAPTRCSVGRARSCRSPCCARKAPSRATR